MALEFLRAALPSIAVMAFIAGVIADCLHPNGSMTTAPFHASCSNDTSNPLSNICCAIQRPNPPGANISEGYIMDECLDNGLCMNRKMDYDGTKEVIYWREECTVKNWTSGQCLDVCTDDVNGGNQQLTPCDGTPTSETWCCGSSNDCCASNYIRIPRDFGARAHNQSNATSRGSSSTESSRAAIAGISVGAAAAAVLVGLAGFAVIKKRHKRSAASSERLPAQQHENGYNSSASAAGHFAYKGVDVHEFESPGAQVVEAPEAHVSEMDVSTIPQELPGGSVKIDIQRSSEQKH